MEVLQGWIDTKIISTDSSSSSSSSSLPSPLFTTSNNGGSWSPSRIEVVWTPSVSSSADDQIQNPTTCSGHSQDQTLETDSGKNDLTQNAQTGIKHYYEVKLKVRGYKPEEIQVHICNLNTRNMVIIEGKHVETTTRIDSIANQILIEETICNRFKRGFELPENIIKDQIECKLSTDEYLVISIAMNE